MTDPAWVAVAVEATVSREAASKSGSRGTRSKGPKNLIPYSRHE